MKQPSSSSEASLPSDQSEARPSSKKKFLFFAASGFAAGVLNYLFQVLSAAEMNTVAFGKFNSWLAHVTIYFTVGSFFRYSANFFPLDNDNLRRTTLIMMGASAIVIGAPILKFGDPSPLWIAVMAVILSVMAAWMSGQAQRRFLFYLLGASGVLAASSKVAAAFLSPVIGIGDKIFYWALPIGNLTVLLIIGIYFLCFRQEKPIGLEKPTSYLVKGSLAAVILAFSSVFIPQLDILVIHNTQDPETIGRFAHISLVYRGVFFLLMVIANWALPYQIDYSRSASTTKKRHNYIIPLVLGSAVLVASALYLSLPLLELLFPFHLSSLGPWVFYSCFNITILVGLFLRIQTDCTSGEVKFALGTALALVAEFLVLSRIEMPVSSYLVTVGVTNSLIFIASNLKWLRSSPSRSASKG